MFFLLKASHHYRWFLQFKTLQRPRSHYAKWNALCDLDPYFRVNASPLKPLGVANSNFTDTLVSSKASISMVYHRLTNRRLGESSLKHIEHARFNSNQF